jgi:benzodiazapine receptor
MARSKALIGLAVSLVLCYAAAAIGGLATRAAPDFYRALVQPSWAPPAAAFGPVWTVLYLLMAIAAWLVWKERGITGARVPLTLFAVQLALNALWSWLFFAWQRGDLAIVEILVLLVFIILTTVTFWRVRPLAGALMLPYLAWVSYATALTIALVRGNPNVL